MVSGSATADAVRRARLMPSLRIGLHIVLVEGRPTLSSHLIPLLVDERGVFRSNMVSLGCLLAYSAQARRQLAAEITAQFAAFHATGLSLDHCNAHKHFHLHPVVAEILITVGARFGLRAIRVPREERRILSSIESLPRRITPLLMSRIAVRLRRRVRDSGLHSTDRVFGLEWSGQMTKDRLLKLIRILPEGLSEIYLHPATDTYPGSAPGYRYCDELDALIDSEVRAACGFSSIKRGGFSDFLPSAARLLSHKPHHLSSPRPSSS
jgi:chitin disaccharide deacetylase